MTDIVVAQRMWQRRDTAANWVSVNPVLNAGEIGVELPIPPSSLCRTKVGDGVTAWNDLPYQDPLPALADTGIGAALVKITRDEKGRIEGQQSAWPDVMARLSMRV